MDDFGRDLGVAFQIADDVLDLWGDERTTGKSLGTDLEKQKLTLPLIRYLATARPDDAARVRGWLAEPDAETRRAIRPHLESSGALDYAWQHATAYARRAAGALNDLPETAAKGLLRSLCQYVVRRPA
jgi:octaprenyl-diphosphate synthase